MARALCSQCGYSLKTCLCHAISIVDNKTKVIILQHPSETKVTKNTAKLLTLGLANCELIVGESAHDFASLSALNRATTAVLYPSEHAQAIDCVDFRADTCSPSTLIVIDGTWKKAYKIMQQTPLLQQFKHISFQDLPENKYIIRKAPRQDSLSTLEAVAHSLQLLEGCPVKPLYKLLDTLIEKQTHYMPEAVKKRYYND